ncbi:MAG TPA: hypothetical protein DD766_09920 [Desulfovibrio sp.]|nr:hypothetical protein [Desulfovibrio sp.]
MHIRTLIDRPGPRAAQALVVWLGPPAEPPGENDLVLKDFGPEDLARVQAVRPEQMKDGLVFCINSQTYAAHHKSVDSIQRHLSWVFCKFVHSPRNPGIPDPCGVCGPKPPNVCNEINRYRNMPWLLRSPLTDRLAEARLGLPLLLVLPGPSLDRLGPRLAELARSCLVVCLSRTLDFCLQRGVQPDFLVQLDTAWRQTHLLPPDLDLPGCALVALSLAPVHGLAEHCRGVFFMDSFDLEVLPNRARLRESWLSSLFPCLGLAEALASPLVLLAGADLSFGPSGPYHNGGAVQEPEAPPFPKGTPLEVGLGFFDVPDRQGRRVTTHLPYFASAHEAAIFAMEIKGTTGTRFCNLGDAGILDPGLFPPPDEAELAALPAIDRRDFLAKLDAALAQPPAVQLIKLKVKLLQTAEMVRDNLEFLRFCRWRKQGDEAEAHAVVSGLSQCCDYLAQAKDMEPAERLDLAISLLQLWDESLARARAVCILEQERGRKGRVPLLCLEDEDPAAEAAQRHPGIRPQPVRLWVDTTPKPGDDYVEYAAFPAWLRAQKVCLVSARAAERWASLLEALPWGNWLTL